MMAYRLYELEGLSTTIILDEVVEKPGHFLS